MNIAQEAACEPWYVNQSSLFIISVSKIFDCCLSSFDGRPRKVALSYLSGHFTKVAALVYS